MDTYISLGSKDKEAKSTITELQKKVAKVARTLPNENVEIALINKTGFLRFFFFSFVSATSGGGSAATQIPS